MVATTLPVGVSSAVADAPPPSAIFHGLTPARLLETRGEPNSTIDDLFEGGGVLGAAATLELDIAGRGGVPNDAGAVALNVTAINPSATSYITVYPTGQTRPTASNLNLAAGRTVPNMVIVPLGTDGHIDIYNNAGTTHLAVDVLGWFPAGSAFQGLTPARLLETRGEPNSTIDDLFEGGGVLGAAATLELDIAGRGGVDENAAAVVLNVTAINPSATSYITVYPTGQTRPTASNLNLAAGRTLPNMVIVPLGTNGHIDIYNNAGTTHLAVDVLGWIPESPSAFQGLTPARLLETRGEPNSTIDDLAEGGGVLGAAATLELDIAGRGGVPDDAGAVALNVTAINPTATSYITVYPTGQTRPTASNLNLAAARTLPNMVIVPLGTNGHISIYNNAGTTHLAVDVLGWFPRSAEVSVVSLTDDDELSNGGSFQPEISGNGNFVSFYSNGSLVDADINSYNDVYVRDLVNGTTELVSVSSDEDLGDNVSYTGEITPDGRFVAFYGLATTLVDDDTNDTWDVFVRDRQSGTTERVSVASNDDEGNDGSYYTSISDDGRFVVFSTDASNFAGDDTNTAEDIALHDRQTGTTTIISRAFHLPGDPVGNDRSSFPRISGNGQFVVFESYASNLVADDGNNIADIFRYEVATQEIIRVSLTDGEVPANDGSQLARISDDGTKVVFTSYASNLSALKNNDDGGIFLRDITAGTTTYISRGIGNTEANNGAYYSHLSGDGSVVVFESYATNLTSPPTGGNSDIFLHDVATGETIHLSVSSQGVPSGAFAAYPTVSDDGDRVVFMADAALAPTDTNNQRDIYLYDRS
ncbi:MAG TPA: hypothetical protein DCR14_10525 [Acidimicrobiaceae bacterium]|nr:hypothetical protein [Acidimicrobiaceae bacterium]